MRQDGPAGTPLPDPSGVVGDRYRSRFLCERARGRERNTPGDGAYESAEKVYAVSFHISLKQEDDEVTEKRECREETLPLPPEVEESLYQCGGIAGLTGQLPGDDLLKRESALFRALADPLRLKILAMLAVQPLCVCVIKAVLGIADSKLSYHLSVLKKTGLIAGEAQGNWIIYRLTADGTARARQVIGDGEGRKNG